MNEKIGEETNPYLRIEDLQEEQPAGPNIAERLDFGDPEMIEIAEQIQIRQLEMKRLIMKMRLEEQIKGKKYQLEDGSTVTVVRIKPMALQEAVLEVEDEKKGLRLIPESEFKGKLVQEQKAA